MNKIILSFKIKLTRNMSGGTASYKAPADVLSIATLYGYKKVDIDVIYRYGCVFRILYCMYQLFILAYKIPKKTLVLYQYPEFHPLPMLISILFFKYKRKGVVIHDINSIRNYGVISWYEIALLRKFDDMIVHTENMKSILKERYKIRPHSYYVLNAFPYLSETDNQGRVNRNCLCFAGNLDKSFFLPSMFKSNPKIHFNLYGVKDNLNINDYSNVSYNGFFKPDNVVGLKGSWGLVWDGNSIYGCEGNMGKYHRIIAPHKFSLFIVAGMPVIVWKESAMAHYVEENKIGICLDSISDIYSVIKKVSDADYYEYCRNIRNIAKILSNGDNLKEILGKMGS